MKYLFMTFLLFLGLKLGHVIAWSWWWVSAPLWGIPALILGGFLFAGTGYWFLEAIDTFRRKRARRKRLGF